MNGLVNPSTHINNVTKPNEFIPFVPQPIYQCENLPAKEQKFISVEVMVNFHCPLIQNNGTFYTDSNGLNMMKR
jgi:hypothetical protein